MKTTIGTFVVAMGLMLTGCATSDRQDLGMVAGGILGGVAGHELSGGNTAGTVAGAVGGAYIGNKLAK